MGREKLESRTSAETGKDSPYLHHSSCTNDDEILGEKRMHLNNVISDATHSNSFSKKTTGSGSLIAAFSRPRASSEEYGASTFNPGHAPYHAA